MKTAFIEDKNMRQNDVFKEAPKAVRQHTPIQKVIIVRVSGTRDLSEDFWQRSLRLKL